MNGHTENGTFDRLSLESNQSSLDFENATDAKKLKQQNEKFKGAILKLQQLVLTVETRSQDLESELDDVKFEKQELVKTVNDLKNDKDDMFTRMRVLEDERDALLSAEDIIRDLTEKNIKLEDRLQKAVDDASQFDEMTRMLIAYETLYKENEKNFKFDIEALEFAVAGLKSEIAKREQLVQETESQFIRYRRKLEECKEEIQDRDDQILRLQEELMNLPADGSNKKSNMDLLNHKRSFADIVKSEFASLQLRFSRKEIDQIIAFLPENFSKSGGDRDLLSVCLSFPRIAAKSKLLMELIAKQYPDVPGGMRKEHVTETHRAEQMSYVDKFVGSLQALLTIVNKLESISQQTTLERMSKLALQEPEVAKHEKLIDNYFDLLKSGKLDENTAVKDIDRCTLYFDKMCSIHYSQDDYDTNQFASNVINQFQVGFRWLRKDVQRLELSVVTEEAQDEDNLLLIVLRQLSEAVEEAEVFAIRCANSMPKKDKELNITNDFTNNLLSSVSELDKATKTLEEACSVAASQLSIQTDSDGLSTNDVLEMLVSSAEKVYSTSAPASEPARPILDGLSIIKRFFFKLSENLDSGSLLRPMSEKKWETPVVARSQMRREDADKAESIKWDLKKKEDEINRQNKVIKQKLDDISALKCRLDLAKTEASKSSSNKAKERDENELVKLQAEYDQKRSEFEQILEEKEERIAELEELADGVRGSGRNTSIHRIMDFAVPSDLSTEDSLKLRLDEANKRIAVLLMELQKAKYNKMNQELLAMPKLNIPHVASGPHSVSMITQKNDKLASLVTEARKLEREYPKLLIEPMNKKGKPIYEKTLVDFNRNVDLLCFKVQKEYSRVVFS